MQYTDLEELNEIDSDLFISEMSKKWEEYDLSPSPPLQKAWKQLAETLNQQFTNPTSYNWTVTPMPTGTGKTLGLALYCALMAKHKNHPGILIVTQFKKEADELKKHIDKFSEPGSALAYHGDIEEDISHLCDQSSTLIVTHSAFRQLMAAKAKGETHVNWHKFMAWNGGERKLLVIDEALDVVEHVKITIDDLKIVRAIIPAKIAINYPDEIGAIEKVIETLLSQQHEPKEFSANSWKHITSLNYESLLKALKAEEIERLIVSKENRLMRSALYEKCEDVLTKLSYLLTSWSHFYKVIYTHHLSSAYVVLPPELKNAVILDATAMPNRFYDLLAGIPKFVSLPENIRNYKNVKLHIFWGYRVGKGTLTKETPEHYTKIISFLDSYIGKQNKVLFCSHKDTEKHFKKVREKYAATDTIHWGDIAGKNKWKEYDSIVIYGLPFLDYQTPKNIVRAFIDWHDKAGGKYEDAIPDFDEETLTAYYHDIFVDEADYEKNEYLTGHIIASLIQAINRIRCRKVIDSEGNCKDTNIYLFLGNGQLYRDILAGIRDLMPGCKTIEYQYPNNTNEPKSRDEDKLVKYLERLKPGEHDANKIQQKLKISDTTMERMVKQIKNGFRLKERLANSNISYDAKPRKGGYKHFIVGESGSN